ncbi:lactate utilization protein C [Mesobacillus maritimus]|uniref:LutC/YkgG family protein n=1 Tax=Mesobacillus maritimus TaxID=1643336 RepID=UPI00203B6985|nr:lactate utilization protein C [Mesobacillus maritimus]MCM3670117.1 lactate utilization protein C [Mesobacillus maritimus]
MAGSIQNREAFLNNIANNLGRDRLTTPVNRPTWKHNPQDEVLKGASQDDLVQVLTDHCEKIHTTVINTTKSNLASTLNGAVQNYGGGPVVTWKDDRFAEWGLKELFTNEWAKQEIDYHEWDFNSASTNINYAEKANIGITISEYTLAESATVVMLSSKDHGRTVNFLPKTYIALVPKSSIVPRMTQAAKKLRERHLNGKSLPACINFISGPSNSADIELQLVVGVHGPFKATYIIIDDL